jgi:conjugal transfer mating pair stabilization protein TraG
MLAMMRDYAAEKGVMTAATTLHSSSFGGQVLPTSKRQLERNEAAEEAALPNDIDVKHRSKEARAGFRGAAPMAVDTSAPAIATATQQEVKSQLDPTAKGSVPERAGALDENAKAWASPDKKVGEGRANPMSVVEGMEGRDVEDSLLKVWDKVKGGDGSADGEKLNDNMRRDTETHMDIGPKRNQ